jgi:hypothetical protein
MENDSKDKMVISPIEASAAPPAEAAPVAALKRRKRRKTARKKKTKSGIKMEVEDENAIAAPPPRKQRRKKPAKKTMKRVKPVVGDVVEKVMVRQKRAREDIVAQKRDPCKALQTYGYVVSHGELHRRILRVPDNLRLIQFATPAASMYGPDVYGIVQQLAEVGSDGHIHLRKRIKKLDPPPILVDKHTGNIFMPDGNDLLVTEPGEETTDMGLTFDVHYKSVSPLFGMHIMYPDGTVVWPCNITDCERNTTLGDLLAEMSRQYAKICPKRVLNLVQISCKNNAWEPVIRAKSTSSGVADVVQYEQPKKPNIMDVGNLAQLMRRTWNITSSVEKEQKKDVAQGIEVVYGKTRDIRGPAWDATFLPWLDENFHRVHDLKRAKELYRNIRGKPPAQSSSPALDINTDSFVFK